MNNPFDLADSTYGRVRPAYPNEVVDHLCAQALVLVDQAEGELPVAVDLGAGTGKMTRMLLSRSWQVRAVEPAEAMRDQIRLPEGVDPTRLQVHGRRAEDTGLGAGTADLVVAAQSWHWFEAGAAAQEAARLLKSTGLLAIVFNQMDVSVPWVHRLTRIMRSGDVHRVERPPQVGPLFSLPEVRVVRWEDIMSTDDIRDLGTTRSSWLRQDEDGRARMRENLRWYLHDHLGYEDGASVTVPYSTLVWTARPVSADNS